MQFCIEWNRCGLRPSRPDTKEPRSPWEQGPEAWVEYLGTVLICKGRRIRRRRVNGKADIRASLQHARRLGAEQDVQSVSYAQTATVWGGL